MSRKENPCTQCKRPFEVAPKRHLRLRKWHPWCQECERAADRARDARFKAGAHLVVKDAQD